MTSTINLENFSLDNYIKEERKKGKRASQRPGGVRKTGRAPTGRQGPGRNQNAGPRRLEREHRERQASRPVSNKRKLRVSNLPFNVTNQEIYELFSQFGPLSVCKIQYDKLGRSYGTATVEFNEEASARQAVKEYHGAELDGKSISIQYASSSGTSSLASRIGGFKDRSREDRDRHREPSRRGSRRDLGHERRERRPAFGGNGRNGGDRTYNKRRFNDRVRNYRSYRR